MMENELKKIMCAEIAGLIADYADSVKLRQIELKGEMLYEIECAWGIARIMESDYRMVIWYLINMGNMRIA